MDVRGWGENATVAQPAGSSVVSDSRSGPKMEFEREQASDAHHKASKSHVRVRAASWNA